jgi:hypothetical protein
MDQGVQSGKQKRQMEAAIETATRKGKIEDVGNQEDGSPSPLSERTVILLRKRQFRCVQEISRRIRFFAIPLEG